MKSVKLYVLIVMVALLLIGGAYAGWHDDLVFAGTVNTGDIDVQFTDAMICYEQNKDIALVSDVTISADGKSMEVTIDNAYPQLEGNVFFVVKNFGSVPVHLETKVIDYDASALEVENFFCWYCWNFCWNCTCPADDPPVSDPECGPPAAWLELQTLELGTQLGEDHSEAMGSVYFKVSNDAGMNETYTFTITYEFINWNESSYPYEPAE